DFYRRVLGMEPVRFAAGRLALRFGSQKINLHPAGPELGLKAARPTPGSGDLCFLTDEPLEVWGRHLEECRVPILEGPVERTGAACGRAFATSRFVSMRHAVRFRATRPGSRRPGTRSACEPTARRSRGPGGSRSPSRGARVAGSPCIPTSRSHHLTLA